MYYYFSFTNRVPHASDNPGCGQINVVGGGSGKPGPTVSIPGVYTGYEPGILISTSKKSQFYCMFLIFLDIYALPSNFTGYPARELAYRLPSRLHLHFPPSAGPAVWRG